MLRCRWKQRLIKRTLIVAGIGSFGLHLSELSQLDQEIEWLTGKLKHGEWG
jgi:hypothetical protein